MSMNFQYYLPVNVVFGCGKVDEAGELAKQYGSKAMIVTGGSSAKKSGLYDRVKESLKKSGIESILFDESHRNPIEGS